MERQNPADPSRDAFASSRRYRAPGGARGVFVRHTPLPLELAEASGPRPKAFAKGPAEFPNCYLLSASDSVQESSAAVHTPTSTGVDPRGRAVGGTTFSPTPSSDRFPALTRDVVGGGWVRGSGRRASARLRAPDAAPRGQGLTCAREGGGLTSKGVGPCHRLCADVALSERGLAGRRVRRQWPRPRSPAPFALPLKSIKT